MKKKKQKELKMRIPKEEHKPAGALLREFIFGVEDGLIGTLGVVAGVTGALVGNNIIILAGIVEMIAGAISMAAGNYLSVKSQREFYQSELEREKREIEELPEVEREEIREIYRKKGFSGKELEQVVKRITSDKDIWLKVMMEEELGLLESKFESPKKGSIIIFLAFIIGSLIPVFPYLLLVPMQALTVAVIATAVALFVFGAAKTYYTKVNIIRSGIEMAVIGMAAAGIGYYIGYLSSVFV